MTDLSRARALVKELAEVLGEGPEPKRLVDTIYEEQEDGRTAVRRIYSDGSERKTTLPVMHRGMEGET